MLSYQFGGSYDADASINTEWIGQVVAKEWHEVRGKTLSIRVDFSDPKATK